MILHYIILLKSIDSFDILFLVKKNKHVVDMIWFSDQSFNLEIWAAPCVKGAATPVSEACTRPAKGTNEVMWSKVTVQNNIYRLKLSHCEVHFVPTGAH